MRFRRRKSDDAEAPEVGADVAEAAPAEEQVADGTTGDLRARGPWDSAEVEVDLEDGTRVDLGGLIVTGRPGLELQLQVDEATGSV
ncbi:MAG: DUF3710 domain-containing protein, partial [Nocardioides sp.]